MKVHEMVSCLLDLDQNMDLYISDADTYGFLPCTGVSLYHKGEEMIGAVDCAGYSDPDVIDMSDVVPIEAVSQS